MSLLPDLLPERNAATHPIPNLRAVALDDSRVIRAVEEYLASLEAGPVLTSLLRHRSEYVRQAAAQALERVAEPSILEGLLGALNDPSVAVRFSLVGALGRAAGDGRSLSEESKKRLLVRLETYFYTRTNGPPA